MALSDLLQGCFNKSDAGADQLLSDRRGADFPGGVHCCVTKEAAWVPIF